MFTTAVTKKEIIKHTVGKTEKREDSLAVEEPLSIKVGYLNKGIRAVKNISVTMRTPGSDWELAAGFLFTEGIITDQKQISANKPEQTNDSSITIEFTGAVAPVMESLERNFYTTSSCGVCGKASIEAIHTKTIYPESKQIIKVPPSVFHSLPDALLAQQSVFAETGGLHAAALFSLKGDFLLMQEDVGRHNALDKLIGHCYLNNLLPLYETILLLSGRASFELVQKATMAGIPIIAAVGAPSSLAVELAEESGITLIGFLKHNRFNIYTNAHRVEF